MNKTVFIISVLAVSLCMVGCGKKQPTLEEMQEPLSMEALSALNATSVPATPDQKVAETKVQVNVQEPLAPAGELKPLPPSGPYKPTAIEIQTALKNSGVYTGKVDGKIGPMTKKAIEEFQKANGLKADGKAGPKTWALLSSYLNTAATVPADSGSRTKR